MTHRPEHPDSLDPDQLAPGFRRIGARSGDVLMIHSSLRSFGRIDGGADTVIDGAIAAVSPGGTVVVPTFVQKVNGEYASYTQRFDAWDIDRSVSDAGRISETLRLRDDSVRSDDCCNSLAAIGLEASAAMGRHRTASLRVSPWGSTSFGVGSPWDWLLERNALYLLMGTGFHACSILHYVQVLWMQQRWGDQVEGRTWPKLDFDEMGRRLCEAGVVTDTHVGPSHWQAFRAAEAVPAALQILRDQPSLITEIRFRLWRE